MSETRIGVPFLVATTMLLKSCGGVDAAERAQQQLALALLDGAAGDLDVLGDDARRAPGVIDRPYEFSFSMSTTMWISRARPPASVDLADAVDRLDGARDLLVGQLGQRAQAHRVGRHDQRHHRIGVRDRPW